MEWKGTKTLVAGLGLSGMAATELLCAHGAAVSATDLRPLEQMPGVAERLGELGVRFQPQGPPAFRNVEVVVVSPGVPADLAELADARARGVRVIGEVELAYRFLEGPVIGITGSNGKTTTTALTGHILRECGVAAQVGGNIGDPPANMIASSRPGQWNVLELSSFQLETIEEFHAPVAAILNVTPDHLDRHHTMEAYTAAKRRILETQVPGDTVILNANDPVCRKLAGAAKSAPVWFSSAGRVERGLWIEDGEIVFDGRRVLAEAGIPLRGRHNVENVMAATAAATAAGAELEMIAAAVRTFPGVEHRLEYVRRVAGVEYYNDSKATNVDATLKAVDAFPGRLWIILGGKDKGSDYAPLAGPLSRKAKCVLLVGAAAGKIARQLGDAVPLLQCETIARAVEKAHRRAQPGDVVLLAPACASFDQFASYEHRGRTFKSLVNALDAETHRAGTTEEASCA